MLLHKSQDFLVSNCDDPNKPNEVHSQKIREKVIRYFEETLLSRLNNSSCPIVVVQQRLHINDLSGYLIQKGYKVLKESLVDENGDCILPNQYTPERIKELQDNNYLFQSQYQQNPIEVGGSVIKIEDFKTYDVLPAKFKTVYLTCDTAVKTKESSDYSVVQCWGKLDFPGGSEYYLIDMIRGKWEFPQLENNILNFYIKCNKQYKARFLICEDKASGSQIIQVLRKDIKIPIKGIIPTKDKYTRLSEVLPKIAGGYVYLPKVAPWKSDFLAECESFRADMSHEHEDQIDTMVYALNDKLRNGFIINSTIR